MDSKSKSFATGVGGAFMFQETCLLPGAELSVWYPLYGDRERVLLDCRWVLDLESWIVGDRDRSCSHTDWYEMMSVD